MSATKRLYEQVGEFDEFDDYNTDYEEDYYLRMEYLHDLDDNSNINLINLKNKQNEQKQ